MSSISLLRLRKPLEYYHEKYDTPLYGFLKIVLLLSKQSHRGLGKTGIASFNLAATADQEIISIRRNSNKNALDRIMQKELSLYYKLIREGIITPNLLSSIRRNYPFCSELYVGAIESTTNDEHFESFNKYKNHFPVQRKHYNSFQNIVISGDISLNNMPSISERIRSEGGHPGANDRELILTDLTRQLDLSFELIYDSLLKTNTSRNSLIRELGTRFDLAKPIGKTIRDWDGGYSMVGAIARGYSFAFRDPLGVKPLYQMVNDEFVAISSDETALKSAFSDQSENRIQEVPRGDILIVSPDGQPLWTSCFAHSSSMGKACPINRFVLSCPNSPSSIGERIELGRATAELVYKSINKSLENTVFTRIGSDKLSPINEFKGLVDTVRNLAYADSNLRKQKHFKTITEIQIESFLDSITIKNELLIFTDRVPTGIKKHLGVRPSVPALGYETVPGLILKEQNVVILDTLLAEKSYWLHDVIPTITRLNPKRIVLTLTLPAVRFPNLYGANLGTISDYLFFSSALELLTKQDKAGLEKIYYKCIRELNTNGDAPKNVLKELYNPFSNSDLLHKSAELLRKTDSNWFGEIEIIAPSLIDFQNRTKGEFNYCCFSGNYPTPSGTRAALLDFVQYYENRTYTYSEIANTWPIKANQYMKNCSIFLSHNWSDKEFARKLARSLTEEGVKVWIDEAEIQIGDSLISKIREGIDQMNYLGVILSPNSVKSEWVKREVDIAMNQEIEGKRVKVLPIVHKECDLPWFLKGKLYADFVDEDDYDNSLNLLLKRLMNT